MKNTFNLCLIFLALAGAVACKKKSEDPQPEVVVEPPVDTKAVAKAEFLNTYANIAFANYSEARSAASLLQIAINDFVANPTAAKQAACKQAYIVARKSYLQTEVFRGTEGNPVEKEGREGLLNSWPLNEAYIDFMFDGNSQNDTVKVNGQLQGYVNDRSKTIGNAELLGLNGVDADDNISVGYHAIEFLLWGQDIYAADAGKRPYSDFLTGATATAPNGDRRGQYLAACASLLVETLDAVINDWKTGVTGNYRSTFLTTSNADASLISVLSAMTRLSKGEFGGERILPGITSQSQEDEHSCFSDLTKDDFKYDVVGFENVLLGKFQPQLGTAISGTGLNKLIENYSQGKSDTLLLKINNLKTKTEVVYTTSARYDQIILKPSTDADVVAVKNMSDAWVELSDALNKANQGLGYGIVPEE